MVAMLGGWCLRGSPGVLSLLLYCDGGPYGRRVVSLQTAGDAGERLVVDLRCAECMVLGCEKLT